ncbi:N-acetylglucosamine-6-phosphate deacetylase [Aliikangiella coralliicola]|uniref:N-acetylglucosamine-6-phosphate deacetylase n=1 Tax=Aliikangiella coralliicola TaxID=2592383 RepID=A0A545UHI0_9GAMM|nr:N-acetylglucosamine-6-phosphate deacetylase [Aliikangiella coralliicola]TQV88919.1 N-acetylglucosamine-6-phosphate deacetylase [Aliikangiella coralliicola]
MSELVLTVEKLFDGNHFHEQQTVIVNEGRIVSIEDTASGAQPAGGNGSLAGTLVAGYIDVQVNGGGGYLFNQNPDLDTIKQIGKAHQRFGTTGWLPTLITDSLVQMQRAADAIAKARLANVPGVLGVHFEGPRLSVAKRGAHAQQFIRELSEAELELFTRTDLGKVVVTLAPETVPKEAIKQLTEKGVIVCIGHSSATYEQTSEALSAGATGFTHLFNAMSPLTSREPGVVGAALEDKESFCGLIMDGVHVHPAAAKVAFNAKPNLMLVTDAMPPVGCDDEHFELAGQQVLRQGNTLTNSEGNLAGSALDMANAVKNANQLMGLSLSQAINLATINPARFLGIDKEYGSLGVGKKASMVLLNNQCEVVASWIDGVQVV